MGAGGEQSAGFGRLPTMSGSKEAKNLEKAKLKAQKSHNLREEANICNQLGEVLAKHGQFQEAIKEHRLELQLSEVLSDVIGCAVANRKIGECLAEIGNYTSALKYQRRHLELARSVVNDIEEQRAWATIGRTYLFIYETDQAREPAEEAENAFRKSLSIVDEKLEGKVSRHELSEMRARLYLNLGILYDSMKDPVKCSRYIRKSVFIAEQNNLYEDLHRANFMLGGIHRRSGDFSKAIRCLEAAKECAKRMKEKLLESECFSSIGQVFLSLGDFVAAKRSLKAAFKLGSEEQSECEAVRKSLKYAVKGCRLEEALSELADEEQQEALGLCEQLGDLCCKVGTYQKAINYYRMQLKHAETLRKTDRELAVIHVSLATTFADLKDHEQSVKHYEAELGLRRGNPKEECKTWLNMALAKDEGGQPHSDLEECYRNALQCAVCAQLPRLQLRSLKLLHSAQQKSGHPEVNATQARLEELSRAQGGESGDESESEETENSEPLEDSELELSESDEDDLEGYDKSVPGRRKINRWSRRNEKGETVLHRACIEGNLKHVQCLVAKGHPLNPRDYCGWTPLHEACNHGHLEIVRLLLDHQVNVNDAGGPHCEGITPLHDAITCGNFQVAELLIRNGASVTAKTTGGRTPLDSLHEWTRNYSKHLDQDTKQQCRHIDRLLRSSEARGMQPVQDFRESDLFDTESSQSLAPIPAQPTASKLRAVESDSGRCQRDTGGSGRSRQSSSTAPLAQRRVVRGPSQRGYGDSADRGGNPLASSAQMTTRNRLDCCAVEEEGESSSEEDIDLLPLRPVKKQCGVVGQRSPVGPGGAEADGGQLAALLDDGSLSQEELGNWDCTGMEQERDLDAPSAGTSTYLQAIRSLGSAKSRILLQTLAEPSLNPALPVRRSALIPDGEYVEEDWLEDDLGNGRPKKRPREQWWAGSASGPGEPGHSSEDEVGVGPALLPAPSGRLALQKKRSRQMRMTQIVDRAVVGRTRNNVGSGRNVPNTSDSASTSPPHSLSAVHQFAPTVHPAVPSSIRVRVRIQDKVFLIPIPHSDSEVRTVSWLAEQATQRYYLMCGLRPKLTLKKEGALLAPQDPIVHVLQSNEESLEELNLSLNPLGDSSSQSIASLLRSCPVLSTLRLQACGLTAKFLQHYRLLLADAMKSAVHLKTLCLSHNALGSVGVELILRSLPHDQLAHLDIAAVVGTHSDGPLMEHLVRYLSQDECCLTHLNLSGNRLTDDSIRDLSRCLFLCPSLVSLDMSANCGITRVGVEMLLGAVRERSCGMQYLSVSGSSVQGPLNMETVGAKLVELKLCSSLLNKWEKESVASAWREEGGRALHTVSRLRKCLIRAVPSSHC
uniref:tonsoku-like protein isoform X2 n=1 Tax=Pristiophorus japonicus TaxID=55135 RepID=UPI00398EBFCD